MVHGAWHGGWCWKRVVPFLTMKGHDVHTPTLSGCGEHAHTATAGIDLNAHVDDVRAYLFLNDLHDVILVGHSYGGMVITGAADRIADRIGRLVYLDAFVPADGDSGAALAQRAARGAPALGNAQSSELLSNRSDDFRIPPPTAAQLGASMDVDADWLTPRLTPMPAQTAFTPLHLTNSAALSKLPKSYILCLEGTGLFRYFASSARAAGWDSHELDAGHDAMITKPRATADVMLAIAALDI
jgi:pimeloyl-ACP methyl ester carboxylesterase